MSELTLNDRKVISALIDTGIVAAAQKQIRMEQAAKRSEARAKLASVADLEAQIAIVVAQVKAADNEVAEALKALSLARNRHTKAYWHLAGLEQSRDGIQLAVNGELYALADERCRTVDLWLANLRRLASGAVRNWQEPHMRKMTLRGVFGLEEHDVSQLVDASNIDEVNSATAALDALRAEIESLVRDFDGDDVGPELQALKAKALVAIEPLVKGAHIRANDLPSLEIGE